MQGRAGGSIGRMEGANHSSQGRQMNDAGNQYLGAGVEIRAVVAAVASLAAQEAQASLGGVRQRQQCGAPSSLLHILRTLPPVLPSSPSSLLPCSWVRGAWARRCPTQQRQGTWEMEPWASQSWKSPARLLPASVHSLTRPQVLGCVPGDPALCTEHCHSRCGQQGADLAATLLIAFPRLPWPQDSGRMRLTLIP